MARLDPLLRELTKHGSAILLLESGHRPRLSAGQGEREISPTVLQSPLIASLLKEVGPAEGLPATIDSQTVEFTYRLEDHRFQFEARSDGGSWVARVTNAAVDTASPESVPPPGEAPPVEAPPPTSPSAAPAGELPEVVELLSLLLTREGSDLHLSSKQKPRMRIHGELLELEQYAAPSKTELRQRLWKVTPERNQQQLEERQDTDFALEIPGQARFRVNLFMDRSGIGAVFRNIPFRIPSFEELGLPKVLRRLAHLSKGLVLVTGPTGSGKSTTLAAILDLINSDRPDHIITIEDPIEFVHPSKLSLINQREVGIHTRSFGQALRAALREDPDVILVGEMRDLETISIAIETAETGHLVFGTLHTTTAPSTVERIVDQFPGDRQDQIRMMLADSLRAVIAQTLLKKVEGGQVAAFEILICTPAVSNLIREGKTFQIASAMQTGRKLGMLTLTDSLYQLVKKKVVTPEEAYLKAIDKDALVRKLQADDISVKLEGLGSDSS